MNSLHNLIMIKVIINVVMDSIACNNHCYGSTMIMSPHPNIGKISLHDDAYRGNYSVYFMEFNLITQYRISFKITNKYQKITHKNKPILDYTI